MIRNRNINHDNHYNEDGHYYISISDLMTSLLFIFILILAYMMLSFVEKKEQLNREIKKLESNLETRTNLLHLLQNELLEKNINVNIDTKNGNMRLKSDLLFESGSATISSEGVKQINILANILVNALKEEKYLQSIDTVFIEGHTDDVPFSANNKYHWTNKELSAQRAINTFMQMNRATNNEISLLKNINQKSLFSYSGYAETRPLCLEKNKACRDKNRRIEFYFSVNTPEINKRDK